MGWGRTHTTNKQPNEQTSVDPYTSIYIYIHTHTRVALARHPPTPTHSLIQPPTHPSTPPFFTHPPAPIINQVAAELSDLRAQQRQYIAEREEELEVVEGYADEIKALARVVARKEGEVQQLRRNLKEVQNIRRDLAHRCVAAWLAGTGKRGVVGGGVVGVLWVGFCG